MINIKNLIYAPLILMLLQIIVRAQTKEIVAYFPEWSVTHQPYYVKNIERSGAADKITVLCYAFCQPAPDSSGNIVPYFMNPVTAYQQIYSSEMSIDGAADDSTQPLRGQFNQLKKLKLRHPGLKILISIGGWTGSAYLSDAALTADSREKFADAVIDRYVKGNLPVENNAGGRGSAAGIFDGIDFDWEFPISDGNVDVHHNPEDNDNLTELYALFRKKLDAINPKLLLTSAVPANKRLLRNYNISKDQEYLDWYNLMTYDFRGGWDTVTGHHTNLLSSADATGMGMKESFDQAIRIFRDSLGVRSEKIVPGAAFYGRGWIIKDTSNIGLYKSGTPAPGIYEAGFNYYSDLIPLLKKGYVYHWDNRAMAPVLFSPADKTFWTLDDEKSAALKSLYADAHNLRGIMFWEITGDDTAGRLINAIHTRRISDVRTPKALNGKGLKPVSITNPLPSDKIYEGMDVIIKTDAAQNSSDIAKVEFICDGKSLGYDTNSPFSWVWFNVRGGKHELRVVAAYKNGVSKNSSPVFIIVKKSNTDKRNQIINK